LRIYIFASNATSCGLLISLASDNPKSVKDILLNFVYSEEYDSDEDDALQSKSNFNIGFIP
jgi:hypothetical protein